MQRSSPNYQWPDDEFTTLGHLVEGVLRARGLNAVTDAQDLEPERFDEPHDDLHDAEGDLVEPRDLDDVIAELRARVRNAAG